MTMPRSAVPRSTAIAHESPPTGRKGLYGSPYRGGDIPRRPSWLDPAINEFGIQDLCHLLGIKRYTLWRWRRRGWMPPGHALRLIDLLRERAAAHFAFANELEAGLSASRASEDSREFVQPDLAAEAKKRAA